MPNNIFDYIKDDFFNIFVGTQYKRINYDILQFLYNTMDIEEQAYTKNELVDKLVPFLSHYDIDTDKTLKEFCFERINILIDFGWLLEDNDGFKKTYELDENGIKLLQVMDEISKNETKQYEFSGYVYNIYNSLTRGFNFDKSVGILEQAYRSSIELRNNLKGLNSNIRKYLTNLIKNNKARPKDILNVVLLEYQDKVILKAFKNFREKDNPSLYKAAILNKIDDFQEVHIEKIIDNYIEIKCSGDNSDKNRKIAYDEINNQLNSIYDLFDNIEVLIKKLEIQNTKYLSSAKARVRFLLNENQDIEGNIVKTLKSMEDLDDEFYDEDIFKLYEGLNIDENSLYTQPIKKEKIEGTLEDFNPNDNDIDLDAFRRMLLKENDFNVENINKYALSLLGDNNSIHLKDVTVKESKDIIKMFLIIIYSNNKVVSYKIKKGTEKFVALDWTLEDYIVERREK